LRATGFGFSSVILGIYLNSRGLSSGQIGVIVAVAMAAASLTGLGAAQLSTVVGRRRTLALTGLLMTLSGLGMVFATQPWLLGLAAATGMLGPAGSDLGPFLSVEQTVLTEVNTPANRNRAFARYSVTGALAAAAGGAIASLGTSVERIQGLFLLYAGIGVATAVLPLFLSRRVEVEAEAPVFGALRPLIGLSALFAVDSLGGGLIVRTVLAYWLHLRFGVGADILGPAFAIFSIAGAVAFEAAGWLSDRIGLVNTMVFTHLPSNLLLMTVPFWPNLPLELGVLLVWSTTQGMDVPARQAYVVSIVKPNERSGAVAVTGSVRGLAQAVGPVITGFAIQSAALGLPFVLAGAVKVSYDLLLYRGYRHRLGDHEAAAGELAS
jgi:MFS family permease